MQIQIRMNKWGGHHNRNLRHEGCRQWSATLVVEQIKVLQQEMCYVGTCFNIVRFECEATQFLRDQEALVMEGL